MMNKFEMNDEMMKQVNGGMSSDERDSWIVWYYDYICIKHSMGHMSDEDFEMHTKKFNEMMAKPGCVLS